MKNNYLNNINTPEDIKNLNPEELQLLAGEIRSFILDVVSVHPGHLGASLGAVELAVALHYVFNTPYDVLIWDVGHQAYAHKILTGRRSLFHTLRQLNGIGGFPSPAESDYDAFVAGHASTAISALLGMEKAAQLKKIEDKKFVAVVGDGSITGGMAFEAFNNSADSDILIILNDNQIAIDKNTGAIGNYLKKLTINNKNRLSAFKSLDVTYYGPADGHNIAELITTLQKLKNVKGPKLLHVLTVKGKGFKKAEEDQTLFHAPGKFDRTTGNPIKTPEKETFPEKFGKYLTLLAEKNNKIVAVTPAMVTGSSLHNFNNKFPERLFDVGIAEQHAVTFAAGMAKEGLTPFCVIYSTFLQRAYDQVIHDVALQKLPVVFAVDRAGLVGEDGATHHGAFDLAFMRSIPNMVVSAPMDGNDLEELMELAASYKKGPFSIRYSKSFLPASTFPKEKIYLGKGRKLEDGDKIALITLGFAGVLAQKAIEILKNKDSKHPAHYDMRFLKPLDEELLKEVFKHYDKIITIEDGVIKGGLSDAVMEIKEKNGVSTEIISLGIPDRFIPHGKRSELYDICGYSPEKIAETVLKNYENF